jgi:transposase
MLWKSSVSPQVMETKLDTIIMSRDEMERRRLEAAVDLNNGLSQSKVARKFGVSRTTASRWHRALEQAGPDSLKKRRATGRPCRLTAEQFTRIPEIYTQGALSFGFPDNRWTTARLAAVIETHFGVRYDHDHVGRLMHKLGLRTTDSRRRAAAAVFAPSFAAAYGQIQPGI